MITAQQIDEWMATRENEHLEFKQASNNFHFDTLVKYCAALANEGGGRIVLGVTDKLPRLVVGSNAFQNLERTKAGLAQELHLRVEVEAVDHPGGRVVVVTAPARPIGMAVPVKGAYWMRAGEDLVPMTPDQLRRIFDEAGPDFTAEICAGATLDDLDAAAIEFFRVLWDRKAPGKGVRQKADSQLLADAELLVGGAVTYAALILLGTREALGRHLAQAELVFEFRSTEAPGPAGDRSEFRQGFLPVLDEVWKTINLRNEQQHFQQGLFVWDVPTFNERVVREAVLNAVCHRDYRDAGSIFVRQYPKRIEVVSPGGFPAGINRDNLLWEQKPRNRRLAENLARCGLVERAGQGFDLMFRESIRQSKPLPDLSRTSEHAVWVTLHGEVQDPEFLRFLEEIGRERAALFTTEDFLVIDLIRREEPVTGSLALRLPNLREQAVIERVGRGRGTRHILSRRFYRFLGKSGVYTRRRGLDRETNKALLVSHLDRAGEAGSTLTELLQVLPDLSRYQVQGLLRQMRDGGRVRVDGQRRWARWFSVGADGGIDRT